MTGRRPVGRCRRRPARRDGETGPEPLRAALERPGKKRRIAEAEALRDLGQQPVRARQSSDADAPHASPGQRPERRALFLQAPLQRAQPRIQRLRHIVRHRRHDARRGVPVMANPHTTAPGRSRRAFPNRRQIGPRIDTLHADRVDPLQRPPQQRARKRSGSSAPNAARGATHAAGHTITILHNPRHHISPYGMYHCAPYAPHSETWPSDVREGIS